MCFVTKAIPIGYIDSTSAIYVNKLKSRLIGYLVM